MQSRFEDCATFATHATSECFLVMLLRPEFLDTAVRRDSACWGDWTCDFSVMWKQAALICLSRLSHVNVSIPPVVYLCKYVYHWRLVLACVYVLVPFVLLLASMPSFWSGCLIQQDVVWNGKRCNFKWKSGAGCREQPPAWLPSNNSLWGHENYASESVNGKVEEGKTWNVLIFFF